MTLSRTPLLFFFFLVTTLADNDSVMNLNLTALSVASDYSTLNALKNKYYDLEVSTLPNEGGYLLLMALGKTTDPLEVPNLDASYKGQRWPCESHSGMGICIVPVADLQPAQHLSISVVCIVGCQYQLHAYFSQQKQLNLGGMMVFNATKQPQIVLLDIEVPENLNFTELSVVASIDNPETMETSLDVYANVGKKGEVAMPSRIKFQRSGVPVWDQGKGILLKNPEQVKPGDLIKLVVYCPPDEVLTITSKISSQTVKSLFVGEQITDTLAQKDSRMYHLNLSRLADQLNDYSIVLKIKKFSGYPLVTISPDSDFKTTTFDVFTQMTTSLYQLSPKKRKMLGITTQLYCKVTSEVDSVYSISVQMNRKDFMWVTEGAADMSSIEKEEVDNVFYEFLEEFPKGKSVETEETQIYVTMKAPPNAIDFSVRQCGSSSDFQVGNCLVTDHEDYKKKSGSFNVSGDYHQHLGEHTYSFTVPLKNCSKTSYPNTDTYVCYFQLVVWRLPDYSQDFVDYQIQLRKASTIIQLQQGFPKKGIVQSNQQMHYSLSLKSLKNVKQIKFYLTKISGQCFMLVSNTTEATLDQFAGEYHMITSNFADKYYITVRGWEQSYFSVTAVVVRSDKEAVLAPIVLQEAAAQSFTDVSAEFQFGVRLQKRTKFSVTVSKTKGNYYFSVAPVENGKILTQNTVKADTFTLILDPNTHKFSPTNQFLITIHPTSPPISFTIFYTQNFQACPMYPIHSPINLMQLSSEHCLAFQLTKVEDVEIVLTTSLLDLSTQQMNMTYSVQNTEKTITSRFTKIAKEELRRMCPQLQENGAMIREICNLEVEVRGRKEDRQDFTLVVQYAGSDILLFDGVTQRVKSKISNVKPKHFQYTLVSKNTLTLFIKPSSPPNFRVLASIHDLSSVMQKKSDFPLYNDTASPKLFISQTSKTGLTTLTIPSPKLSKLSCKKCIMLISVFHRSPQQSQADFKIEIAQSRTSVTIGQTRHGYVESGLSMQYQVTVKSGEELVVSVNGIHDDCAMMEAFERMPTSAEFSNLSRFEGHNPIFFEKSDKPTVYLVKVNGINTCIYNINFVTMRKRMLEILEGVPLELTLKQGEKIYLLYQHTKNQAFRILSMTDFGQAKFMGKTLDKLDTSNIQLQTSKKGRPFIFNDPKQKNSLTVQSTHPSYCSNCSYLFQVFAQSTLKTTVLLHTWQSSVPLITGKTVYETILKGEFQQYVYLSDVAFNVTVNAVYGEGEVTIMKGVDREVVSRKVVRGMEVFSVGGREENEYVIRVELKEKEQFSYSVFITTMQRLSKITQGIPSTFEIVSGSQCFFFPATTPKNLSLMMQSPNSINSIKSYTIKYSPLDAPDVYIPDTEYTSQRSQNILLLHLSVKEGVYTVCINPGENADQLSVLLFEMGVPTHMQSNKEVMVNTQGGELKVFEIYCPVRGWVMIEGLECRGAIDIIGSKEYQSVIDKKPQLKFTHSKTAGHYVGKARVDPGLYFLGVTTHRDSDLSTSLAILKYSMFTSKGYPYDKFDVYGDQTIKYKFDLDGNLQFTVDRFQQEGDEFKILKEAYRIYVGLENQRVKEASQCNTVEVFNRTVVVGEKEAADTNVTIALTASQLQQIMTDPTDIIFVSIVSFIDIEPKQTHQTGQLRFIYNQAQINFKKVQLSPAKKIMFYFVIPGVVGLIVLIIALRFCVRKIYMANTNLSEEQEQDKRQGAVAVSQADTGKVVVGTGMMSMPTLDNNASVSVPSIDSLGVSVSNVHMMAPQP